MRGSAVLFKQRGCEIFKKVALVRIFEFLSAVAVCGIFNYRHLLFIENMLIHERNVHRKNRTLSQSGTGKIVFLYLYISTFYSLTNGQNIYRIDARI